MLSEPKPLPDLRALRSAAAREIERMRCEARTLERPVVVLGGWRAWQFNSEGLAHRLRRLTSGRAEDFLAVSFMRHNRLETAAQLAIRAVQRRWASATTDESIEVDVIGVSMGGLVARLAAMEGSPRLKIARLFTLATPHRGASLANRIAIDRAARDMRTGSAQLGRLDACIGSVNVTCYARLRDRIVGARNASPHGSHPNWIPGPRALSHVLVTTEPVFIADIALRLRGEPNLGLPCSAPPRD